jgi:hypothetical protein
MFDSFRSQAFGVIKSWTMRFNAAVGFVGGMLGPFQDQLTAAIPQVKDYITPESMKTVGMVMLGLAAVNALLRAKTTSSLAARGDAPKDGGPSA